MEPTEQPQSIKDPAHKGHTIVAFVILALVCAAIGGGAWYYLSTQKPDSYQSLLSFKKNTKKTETTTTTPTATDETANWKTYTSTSMGVSFRYPSNLTLNDITATVASSSPANAKYLLSLESASSTDNGYRFAFTVTQTTRSRYEELTGLTIPYLQKSTIKIGNHDAYVYSGKGSAEGETTVKEIKEIVIFKDGKAYSFGFSEKSPSTNIALIEKIAKTVNF